MKTGPYTLTNIKFLDSVDIVKTVNGIVPENEPAIIALMGDDEEYLICTSTQLYIIKNGYYKNTSLGKSHFQIAYSNITNVSMKRNIYFGLYTMHIVAAGSPEPGDNIVYKIGVELRNIPNIIAFNKRHLKEFKEASDIIMSKVTESRGNSSKTSINNLVADELIKLKNLMDQGIITKEEFERQKQKLLY